jgi:hypothetical protein
VEQRPIGDGSPDALPHHYLKDLTGEWDSCFPHTSIALHKFYRGLGRGIMEKVGVSRCLVMAGLLWDFFPYT